MSVATTRRVCAKLCGAAGGPRNPATAQGELIPRRFRVSWVRGAGEHLRIPAQGQHGIRGRPRVFADARRVPSIASEAPGRLRRQRATLRLGAARAPARGRLGGGLGPASRRETASPGRVAPGPTHRWRLAGLHAPPGVPLPGRQPPHPQLKLAHLKLAWTFAPSASAASTALATDSSALRIAARKARTSLSFSALAKTT